MTDFFKICPDTPDQGMIEDICTRVQQGAVVVYPTETFYGIGASAFREDALRKVFQSKNRDDQKPVLLLIDTISCIEKIAVDIDPKALELAEAFWPGPLTLLFKAAAGLSPLLTGNEGKTGCRISSGRVAAAIMNRLCEPLTSTSANITGGPPACSVADIPREVRDRVDIIIDAGKTPGGLASTIVDVSIRPFRIVRHGAIDEKRIVSFVSI